MYVYIKTIIHLGKELSHVHIYDRACMLWLTNAVLRPKDGRKLSMFLQSCICEQQQQLVLFTTDQQSIDDHGY